MNVKLKEWNMLLEVATQHSEYLKSLGIRNEVNPYKNTNGNLGIQITTKDNWGNIFRVYQTKSSDSYEDIKRSIYKLVQEVEND